MSATAPSTRAQAAVKHVGTNGVRKMYTPARQATATKSSCAASPRWRLSADGHTATSTNYERNQREGNPHEMRTGRSSPQGLQLPLLCDATDSVSRHREGRVRRFDSDANTDAKTRQEDQH